MRRYVIRRLLLLIPTLFGVTLINFCVLSLLGDPEFSGGATAGAASGETAPPGSWQEHFGFDKEPLPRFFFWLGKVIRGDFGKSITVQAQHKVVEILPSPLWVSLRLNGIALALTYVMGIGLGVFSARRPNSKSEQVFGLVLLILHSLPRFWVGTLLVVFAAGNTFLDWSPNYELDSAKAYVLPVLTLVYGRLAVVSRYTWVGFAEVLRQDHIRTARAKGLSETTIIWKHAARSALIPVVVHLSQGLPVMLIGSVVVEHIFQVRGLGWLFYKAVDGRDYPVVMAILLLISTFTLVGLLLADVLCAWLDPRSRLE